MFLPLDGSQSRLMSMVAQQPVFDLMLRQAAIMILVNRLKPSTEIPHLMESEQYHESRITTDGSLGLLFTQTSIAVVVSSSKGCFTVLKQKRASRHRSVGWSSRNRLQCRCRCSFLHGRCVVKQRRCSRWSTFLSGRCVVEQRSRRSRGVVEE